MSSYNWIANIDWDGSDLEFHCTYEPGERETRDHPGSDLSVEIHKVLMVLPDKNDNMVTVDVLGILDFDIDWDQIIETIKEAIENDEPDPDADRDDY